MNDNPEIDTQGPDSGQLESPKELLGKSLSSDQTIPKEPTSTSVGKSSNSASVSTSETSFDYAKHLHSYIREYISFAEKKATFVFTVSAAVLIFLYEKGIVISSINAQGAWGGKDILVMLSIVLLCSASFLAVAVVFPRFGGSRRGLVFWEGVASFESANEFSTAAQKMNSGELCGALLNHSYELSKVCSVKFRIVNWAIRVGSAGVVLLILYLVI